MDKPASPRRRKPAAAYYTPASYRPDDSVAYLMRRVLVSFAGEVEHELEPLRPDQRAVGAAVQAAPWATAAPAAELARECRLDAGAMTRTARPAGGQGPAAARPLGARTGAW